MKHLSKEDYRKIDRLIAKGLKAEVEGIEIPDGEWDAVLRRAEQSVGETGTRKGNSRKSWNPAPPPMPLRLTAAAAFIAGLLYLTTTAWAGIDTPELPDLNDFNSSEMIGDVYIGELKDSAGLFFRRVGSSVNLNLTK